MLLRVSEGHLSFASDDEIGGYTAPAILASEASNQTPREQLTERKVLA
jgi:hypothetical protein